MADAATSSARLSKKLGIKPGYKVLVLNAPAGFMNTLETLPAGSELSTAAGGLGGSFDVVLGFAGNRVEVEAHAPTALHALKPGGILWFAYPKKSSKVKTDISRDVGWDALNNAGFIIVSQVAIDEVWGAGRFRPQSEVKVK